MLKFKNSQWELKQEGEEETGEGKLRVIWDFSEARQIHTGCNVRASL